MTLTGQQLQKLEDRFNLRIGLEDGVITAERKDGDALKAQTVAKMLGISEVPENWREVDGVVRGL